MADGIDVVLDQWSLEDGHDINVFMEKMVSDPTIKRVVIISDSVYAAKADGRKGGVGTETQIISKKVYDSVDQNKFIPVLRERDENGAPCLPIYLQTRKYIDFSDPDLEAEAYDQLIRNIFERPKRRKPVLGRPPSHIFDESSISVSSVQKAKRFRETIAAGKGSPSLAFDDFADEFLNNLEDLRMTYSRDRQNTWCEQIRANIDLALSHRDVFVDTIQTGVKHLPPDQFAPLLLQLLERILPFTARPESVGGGFEISEDNYKFLVYEMYLYSMAILIKAKRFDCARALIAHRYIAPRTCRGEHLECNDFTSFNPHARSLEEMCAKEGNVRRLSVMADLLHNRATRKDIRYSDLLQSDALLFLAACGSGWWPRSMIYSRGIGKMELFLRAEEESGFSPLATVLDLKSPQELLQIMESESISQVLRSREFFHADVSLEAMNYQELKRRWGT